MTRLTIFKNGEHYLGFSCVGHSGYADEGYDIVCSAVSTAVQLTASFLVKFHEKDVVLSVDERDALIELKCKKTFEEFDRQLSVLDDFSAQLSEQYSDYFDFDYLEV